MTTGRRKSKPRQTRVYLRNTWGSADPQKPRWLPLQCSIRQFRVSAGLDSLQLMVGEYAVRLQLREVAVPASPAPRPLSLEEFPWLFHCHQLRYAPLTT